MKYIVKYLDRNNKELAKIAGVSETVIMRAKKVKKEAPETYEQIIKEGKGWIKAYDESPSVKEKNLSKTLIIKCCKIATINNLKSQLKAFNLTKLHCIIVRVKVTSKPLQLLINTC